MKESAASKETRVRAKNMATSSSMKTEAVWGRDQKASKEGKTVGLPTHSSDLEPSV